MEIALTPCTQGGMSKSSITVGGLSIPSMRGMEKPHTSASTIPTLFPRFARDIARFADTDDFPTPPLPEAMRRTRVLQDGSAKGMTLPSAWPCAGWDPAVDAGSPWTISRTLARSSSFITPKLTWTLLMLFIPNSASLTSFSIFALSGHPAIVSSTSTVT